MAVAVPLTVAAGKVTSDLTGFVVRVDLSHLSAPWWADTTSDLGNVRVKQSGSVIPFDVVTYDRTAKTGVLYFKAPTLAAASSNVFSIETVDGATALAVTDTNGRNSVWANYIMMLDFAGGPVDGLVNRNGSGNDAVLGGAASISNGWLECGVGAGYAVVTNLPRPGTTGVWTAGVTARQDSRPNTNNRSLFYYTQLNSATDSQRSGLFHDNGNRPSQYYGPTSGIISGVAAFTSFPVQGREHNRNENASPWRSLFYNGANKTTGGSASAVPGGTGLTTAYIGVDDGSLSPATTWVGGIARVMLRHEALSDAWIAAETTSWENPGSFYSVPTDATAAGGTAHETDTASTGAVSTATMIPGGTAHETDTAATGVVTAGPVTLIGGTAHETDTAATGTVSATDPPTPIYGFTVAADLTVLALPPMPEIADTIPAGLLAISVPTPTIVDGRPQ